MYRLVFNYLNLLPVIDNNKYVLIAACKKYIFTKALESVTVESTVKFTIQLSPNGILSDNYFSDRVSHFKYSTVTQVLKNLF